ncbi:hypothetical protein ATW55_06595 [Ferroacidibacillus organovorans]|uniref:Competence protein ComFB n=1 Tax=Ferroacidibacillus organovorans TaxID=1765683 RepID=A0A101XQ83_9BACL|nr:hypothetical protein ATW55_06595 [Ferroacidibacillus organovorans]
MVGLVLVNVVEEVARFTLDEMLTRMDGVCACEVCKTDMLAIALNHLTPHYSSRPDGQAYSKAGMQFDQARVDLIRELTRAIWIVHENCKHA